MAQLINKTKNITISQNVEMAHSIFSRLLGLMGRQHLSTDHCLWLKPCNSVHTFFMKFSIDVVFVNKNLQVKSIKRELMPWKFSLPVWTASSAFEFKTGSWNDSDIEIGDQLYVGN